MRDQLLQLDYDRGDPDWFVLRVIEPQSGREVSHVLLPSEGFQLNQLREALQATDWVAAAGDQLLLHSDRQLAALGQVVGAMFDYYVSPGQPSQRLLRVRDQVNAGQAVRDSGLQFPLFAYAWLDLMVRDDLADEARSAGDVWNCDHVQIDVRRVRDRRVEQLVQRYSAAQTSPGRLAPSGRRRSANNSTSKLG